jgi:hypothetical protein
LSPLAGCFLGLLNLVYAGLAPMSSGREKNSLTVLFLSELRET